LTYPALLEWMTLGVLADGPRQTSTLLLFTEEGQWKACLHDRDGGVQLFRSGETVSEALQSVEDALVSGRADWRERKAPRR